jgi:hypothetical protein
MFFAPRRFRWPVTGDSVKFRQKGMKNERERLIRSLKRDCLLWLFRERAPYIPAQPFSGNEVIEIVGCAPMHNLWCHPAKIHTPLSSARRRAEAVGGKIQLPEY